MRKILTAADYISSDKTMQPLQRIRQQTLKLKSQSLIFKPEVRSQKHEKYQSAVQVLIHEYDQGQQAQTTLCESSVQTLKKMFAEKVSKKRVLEPTQSHSTIRQIIEN